LKVSLDYIIGGGTKKKGRRNLRKRVALKKGKICRGEAHGREKKIRRGNGKALKGGNRRKGE